MGEYGQPGQQALRFSDRDFAVFLLVLRKRTLQTKQAALARECVRIAEPVAYCVRQADARPEYLPVTLELQAVRVQPLFDEQAELLQLSLVRSEYRQVVHIPDVVLAVPALPDQVVQRLEKRVRKPLRRVCADLDTIGSYPLDQIQDSPVFDQALHPLADASGLQTVVEMADVSAQFVLRSPPVLSDPELDRLSRLRSTPAADAPAAVRIHAAHHDWLQHLDQSMMDVLIRPLDRFVDLTPFFGAYVPAHRHFRRMRSEPVLDDCSQFVYSVVYGLFDPCCAVVRLVIREPVVR